MEVMTFLLNGEDMFARCQEQEARQLREKLFQLGATLKDTKAKADRVKVCASQIGFTLTLQLHR